MRVLHVIPSVAPRDGGPAAAITPMCRALMDAGIDVHLASTDADGPDRLDVVLGSDTAWGGVPATFFRRDATEAFKYSRSMAAWLDAHVRDFDLVHIHAVLSHAPIAAGAACRRAGVPYIVRPLGTVASWSLAQKPWRKTLLLALGARQLLMDATAIHCTSDDEKADIERTFGARQAVVLPLGIDTALADVSLTILGARLSHRYVLAMSRLHPKKNYELLIDAFEDARDNDNLDWTLVLAGSGEEAYERQLKARVTDKGLTDVVRFAGWVDGEEKRGLLQRASLFALPSQHENFGVAVLEALTAGVPAIVSRDVHLATELASANAGWVVDATHEALAMALNHAMSHERLRADRGRAAARLAKQFAWPAIAVRMVELYTRVASRRTPRP